MTETKIHAYRFLLSKAMLDIKSISQSQLDGLSRNILLLTKESKRVEAIANLSYSFHNLAIHLTLEMVDFNENDFWNDLEKTTKQYKELLDTDYRSIFDKCLREQDVNILDNK